MQVPRQKTGNPISNISVLSRTHPSITRPHNCLAIAEVAIKPPQYPASG
jgi:hypothetical protein